MTYSFVSVLISSISEANKFRNGISCSHCCFSVCVVFMALGPGIILRFLCVVAVFQCSSWCDSLSS